MPEAGGVSSELREFVSEAPMDRTRILSFLQQAAAEIPAGARVLDAGAGWAPYRELFGHCRYETSDWSHSVYENADAVDIVAPLDGMPVEEGAYDFVINTQVLEHVADPVAVLTELCRILAPGGRLYLTAPFVGELHEEPFDHFRYTPYGLLEVLRRAGFVDVRIQPLSGYFTALAVVLRDCGASIGAQPRWSDLPRRLVATALRWLAYPLPRLDRIDRKRAFPVGYCCRAHRPPA